jgi:hypothetical protein
MSMVWIGRLLGEKGGRHIGQVYPTDHDIAEDKSFHSVESPTAKLMEDYEVSFQFIFSLIRKW